MNKNVGGYDRIGRFVIGAALVIVGIVGYVGMLRVAAGPIPQALMSLILVLIGAILLVTGYIQKCPLNSVLGMNTFKSRNR
ncbi:YgaP family membrane protein [Natronomonas sp.]|uniref:YgaP family membrane protein n=1 Tax=Natronomonas sp. TaxID=2184060 RepID=UPI002FC3C046